MNENEKVRKALVDRASPHRIVARIIERCQQLPAQCDKRMAAAAQTAMVLDIPTEDAKAVVSEMWV